MITALDTETSLPSNAEPVPRLVCVSVANDHGSALIHHSDPACKALVSEVLEGGVAAFNWPFDAFAIARKWPDLFPLIIEQLQAGRVFDGMTRDKLVDIAAGKRGQKGRRYSLAAVADRRCGIEKDAADPWRMRYVELIDTPIDAWPEDAKAYAIGDAVAHWQVYKWHEAWAAGSEDGATMADAARQARKHFALYAQTLIGIATDPEQVRKVEKGLRDQAVQWSAQLESLGLARWQGPKKEPRRKFVCDTKAAAAAMIDYCTQRGIKVSRTPPSKTAPEGNVRLDEETLELLQVPEGHPLDVYRRYKAQRSKLTKIEIYKRPIVRTRYDECKDTGRSGSSGPQGRRKPHQVEPWEWIGDNLQNLPRKGGWREMLVPPPGHRFIISDYSGIELAAFAQVEMWMFGRSKIADAIRNGVDCHGYLAANLMGIPFEQFDRSIRECEERRQFAKIPNFGFLGAMGAARFAQHSTKAGYPLTEAEARRVKNTWLRTWQTRTYFDHWGRVQENSPGGRIRIVQPGSGRIRGGCTYSEACNTNFQGLAIDMAGDALWELFLAGLRPGPLEGCSQVLFVHDENVTAAPADRAEAARAEQDRIMLEAAARWIPDVPVKVESTVVERYCK